ncbi:MAG: hypothetical protein ACX93T_00675 [Bacteroidota bacterium]
MYTYTSCFLLWLIAASMVFATPISRADWQKNINIGPELRVGMPYGWYVAQNIEEAFENNLRIASEKIRAIASTHTIKGVRVKFKPNWQFGVVAGYSVPFYNNILAIGPEVGLLMGTERKVEMTISDFVSHYKFMVQEHYIHVPLVLKLATCASASGVAQESGLVLGYELRVLRAFQLGQVQGESFSAVQSRLAYIENIAKASRWSGSILLEGRVAIFKGCYLAGRCKLPITDLLAYKEATRRRDDAKQVIHGVRMGCETLVEISIGANIMKWF